MRISENFYGPVLEEVLCIVLEKWLELRWPHLAAWLMAYAVHQCVRKKRKWIWWSSSSLSHTDPIIVPGRGKGMGQIGSYSLRDSASGGRQTLCRGGCYTRWERERLGWLQTKEKHTLEALISCDRVGSGLCYLVEWPCELFATTTRWENSGSSVHD